MAITDSLARFSASIIETLQTRLELLSVETEARLALYIKYLLCSLIALFFAGIGVFLLVLLVVAYYWDSHREVAIASLAFTFFGIAAGVIAWFKASLARQPKFLELSIDELGRDAQALRNTITDDEDA
jgi:uncharacterized membrane protein YqjE